MLAVTLTIACIVSVLIVWLKPWKAFCVYVLTLFYYPSYLVIQLGTVDISVSRIVVSVLLIKCLCNKTLSGRFRWCRIDTILTLLILFSYLIPMISRPMSNILKLLENRTGIILIDTYFHYWVGRLCFANFKEILRFCRVLAIGILPLVMLGIYETTSGTRLFLSLRQYTPWEVPGIIDMPRFGLARAVGPFSHPLLFGTALAMTLPFVYTLRHDTRWRTFSLICSVFIIIGVMTSLSSAAVMVLLSLLLCLALEKYKNLVKPVIVSFVLGCVLVETISNRPFYHVLVSYINPLGGTGWHRAKLIDLAIRDFGKWWMFGFRGQDLGWARELGMTWTDITNHYIVMGGRIGILGVILFGAILFLSLRLLIRRYKGCINKTHRSLCWAMSSLLVALIFSFNGITLFDNTRSFFYCFLGIAVTFAQGWQNSNPKPLGYDLNSHPSLGRIQNCKIVKAK